MTRGELALLSENGEGIVRETGFLRSIIRLGGVQRNATNRYFISTEVPKLNCILPVLQILLFDKLPHRRPKGKPRYCFIGYFLY